MDHLLLPVGLRTLIRDRYLAGVSDAQAKYPFSAGDEDSLTGALGNSISMPSQMIFGDGQRQYEYQIFYHKIRGRGPRAPEKLLGADGIFQIDVNDERGRRRKGLPFQAKKGWRSADSNLLGQSRQMIETAGDGIVIDYRQDQYGACRAEDVVQHQANRRSIDRARKVRPLGQMLADDFLDCTIGRPGLFFDPTTEAWQADVIGPPTVEHIITTRISELS
jgi:hypothetical protein